VDILVNNVGGLVMGPFTELEPEGWHLVMAQNLHAACYCCREALADMLPRRSGVIVNIGSGGAVNPSANAVAYCTAKHGLRGLTLSLAEEVRGRGVKVAIVNPVGVIDKPAARKRGRSGKPGTWCSRIRRTWAPSSARRTPRASTAWSSPGTARPA